MQGVSLRICLLLEVQSYPGHHGHLRLILKKTPSDCLKGSTYRNSWEREEMALNLKRNTTLQTAALTKVLVCKSLVRNYRVYNEDIRTEQQCFESPAARP